MQKSSKIRTETIFELAVNNPIDRGAWWAIAHTVAKSWTTLKQLNTHRLLVTLTKTASIE